VRQFTSVRRCQALGLAYSNASIELNHDQAFGLHPISRAALLSHSGGVESSPVVPPLDRSSPLTGSHLRTYEKIFQHPISHNLDWREVHALFRHMCNFVDEPNGNLRVTRNGQTLVLHPPRTKDVAGGDELMGLRHFLERSDKAEPETNGKTARWLVVIDHHEARLFRSEIHGAAGQQILPHEPSDFFRHAPNSKEFSRGQEKPDPNSFFGPVAEALKDAAKILVFGNGTGSSSEMDQFTLWLQHRHPELSRRVAGSIVVDVHHLTEGQVLAKAREFYAK
jgi:hypothetical protein